MAHPKEAPIAAQQPININSQGTAPLFSMAQTMPLVVPLAETLGVVPRSRSTVVET